MNNADFRKLLETPRAERWGNQTPSNKPDASPKPKPKGEHKPHRPHGKPGFKKPADKSNAEDAEDDGAPKYRDRAEERRRGKNLDYEDASAVLSALSGSGGVGGDAGGDLGTVDLSKLSEEETKYLGGDMRFTHLVKGLDYALLHKTRTEITKKKDDDGDGDDDEGRAGGGADAGSKAEAARDAQARANARANAASAAGRKEEVRFTAPLARSVFNTLFSAPRANVREMYLPRRTAFVYDFDNEDSLDTDIPTTLRRPKSECPPAVETLFAGMDDAVLDRIARILSYVRTTADGKRLKRRDRDAFLGIKHDVAAGGQQAVPPTAVAAPAPGGATGRAADGGSRPSGPADEDDDIFGDAGTDYKPTSHKTAKAKDAAGRDQGGGHRRGDGSYFDSRDTMADIPMPGTSIRRPGMAAAAEGGDDMDLEEGEMPPPPPPLPPAPAPGAAAGAGAGGIAFGAQAGAQYGAAYEVQGYDQYNMYGGQQGYGMDSMAAYGAGPQYGASMYGAVQQGAKVTGNAYGTTEEPKWRSRPKDAKARGLDAEADDDAYAECYPGMAGYVGALVDSDDEGGDLNHMDSKQAKGKTRADFATDEEWQRYKESRETLPRAAFQYGVKRADGRKSHKELEKGAVVEQRQRDQKLDGQLRKIERLLQDKGHDHGQAFARKPKESETGAGGAPGSSACAYECLGCAD
ncbi:hypothetical protein VOLCADRAFT_105330 [Volvox carteri f. nagariensis]|uniref:RED-like N-terminal domain-containing protein n=1 Tax=Volvox carteri f. nagariensis TaxID=3068 RepID=D8U053_VOLCA|nr:uncharacterized protein VOLCADRAFT_105330 [Volvox carteri f. nagariensis]EFJ46806.1 hypothetical protein VOLCADRAFT_105330 [Volvox carteri f. nagariensis]|eukprot:XP_002952015.1 hypothetical protein VOLCADRAFT_105330 [Volvox carteri f. nagariensis]